MKKKSSGNAICEGNINTSLINNTHKQIKGLVKSYKEVNDKVSSITLEVNENWVGKGQTEFESQYNLLIKKIDDFGDTLQDVYEALVEAEASYEDVDDDIRQNFTMAMDE